MSAPGVTNGGYVRTRPSAVSGSKKSSNRVQSATPLPGPPRGAAHDPGVGIGQRGFTRQELRDIFNLDPDRPEDLPAIAALRASSTRQLDQSRPVAAQRNVRDLVRQLLSRHSRSAA